MSGAGFNPVKPNSTLNEYLGRTGAGTGGAGGGDGSSPHQIIPDTGAFTEESRYFIPDDPKVLNHICKYLAIMSPVHKAYVRNMSRLPVTNIIVKETTVTTLKAQHDYSEGGAPPLGYSGQITDLVNNVLRIKKLNQEVGVQFWSQDAAIVILIEPFRKMLICRACDHKFHARDVAWTMSGAKFRAECPDCNHHGETDVEDVMGGSSYLDYDIEVPDMALVHTVKSGRGRSLDVYLELPESDVKRLTGDDPADRDYILETPQTYLEAACGVTSYTRYENKKVVKLQKDHYYVMRNTHLTQEVNGLPYPGFACTLQDYWRMNYVQMASEALSKQHIIPFDVLYPESSSRAGNLFEFVNMAGVMDTFRSEAARWQQDKNYRAFVPFPIASTRIGGDISISHLSQDVRVYMEILCAAIECPIEFLFGGLSYSGSDVSIQQVVKKLEDYREDLLRMNKWLVNTICQAQKWPRVEIEFEDFRMGQDLPHVQMVASLVAQNKVSMSRLHRMLKIETESERAEILNDVRFENQLNTTRMVLDARAQQEAMITQTVAQAKGQVLGQETMLEESMELADRVRADPEFYNYVQGNPETSMMIFGANAPEVQPAGQPQMESVDPAEVSPYAAAEGVETDQDMQRIIAQVGQTDIAEWPALIESLRNRYGEAHPMVDKVVSTMFNAQAAFGQRSVVAEGKRDPMLDYGSSY